jgi:hypothetical protein
VEEVRRDTERDRWLTASEAHRYGIVDRVLDARPESLGVPSTNGAGAHFEGLVP